MEKYYNSKVQSTSFKTGDLVYRNDDTSRAEDTRKLGPKWEGPYEVMEALGKGAYNWGPTARNRALKKTERSINLGPERPEFIRSVTTMQRTYWDNVKMLLSRIQELTKEDREINITLYDDFEHFRTTTQRKQGNNALGAVCSWLCEETTEQSMEMLIRVNLGQVKCYNCNGIGHIARNYTQPKRPQNSEYFKDKMLLMQAQENGGSPLDEEQLLI
ncbi:retrovirus-related pol polyprotein from transposon TNT 1-94 [Tanacetum coccineum]